MVSVADVSERPLVALGSGSEKRRSFMLWFITVELCSRNVVKPKLSNVPLEFALFAVLLRYSE